MKSIFVTIAFVLCCGLWVSAQAQHRPFPHAHKKMMHMPHPHKLSNDYHHRPNGKITPQERLAIRMQSRDVRIARKMAYRDGYVTAGERQMILNENRQLNRAIHKAKRW